jgi:ribosome-associated protein
LKREMTALQDLGAELVGAIEASALPRSRCRSACAMRLLEAQRITKHEARRRQMQYIGKIMRDVDAEPLAGGDGRNQRRFGGGQHSRQHQLENACARA